LALENSIVTLGAMGCQSAIAEQILAREGDYLLVLKANHPTARGSVRRVLSWPVLSPSSVATSDRLRPSSSRLTACALNSAVNRRRVRLSAIPSSWSTWVR
jgi:hypothetical protein